MSNTSLQVKFVRWPTEAGIRNQCRREGIPCLLVVEANASPPATVEVSEDWIRSPASRQDVEARVQAIRRRIYATLAPTIDSTGVLHFNNKLITVSQTQAELMVEFIAHYKEIVYRSELEQQLAKCVPNPTRNALDLHIMRLRRRLPSVNLSIRTVWGRGYILEPTTTT